MKKLLLVVVIAAMCSCSTSRKVGCPAWKVIGITETDGGSWVLMKRGDEKVATFCDCKLPDSVKVGTFVTL